MLTKQTFPKDSNFYIIKSYFNLDERSLERNPGNIRTYTVHYNIANFCPDVITRDIKSNFPKLYVKQSQRCN